MKDGNSIQAVVQPPQPPAAGAQHLLEAQELQVTFPVGSAGFGRRRLQLKAVQGVSFGLNAGETVGLVGESGCGKSTLGRALAGLVKPTAGRILFHGNDLAKQSPAGWRAFRRQVQIVFQDSQGALSPRLSVEELIGEGLDIHRLAKDSADRRKQVRRLLAAVGLDGDLARRYPHQLSGGQRQRVGLARALAVQPKILILDEPLSALDVSVQAQIVNLLQQLREERGLTFLLIAHDLAVVEHLSQRMLVMYLGKMVEQAEAQTLTRAPRHPYTQALLSAVAVLEPVSGRKRIILAGEPPSPLQPPSGCPFHTRCPVAELPRCQREAPTLREVAPGHWVACHLAS